MSSSSSHELREQEQLDHAIALSLADEENSSFDRSVSDPTNNQASSGTQRHPTQSRPPNPQNSSGAFRTPAQGPTGFLQRCSQYMTKARPYIITCHTCSQPIFGTYQTAMDKTFHSRCFTCAACQRPFNGQFIAKGEPPLPYHRECVEELFNPRCCVCSGILRHRYLAHPFFKEDVYCEEHDSVRQCFSCCRKEPFNNGQQREGFAELHDGRVSCIDCISTAIVDSSEALPLYLAAVDFMENVLHLPIPKGMREVPILAVDLPSLNEQQKNNRYEAHRAGAVPEGITRGLTLSSIGHVRHMTAGSFFDSVSGFFTAAPPQVYNIEEVREVTAVLVLYALPRDLTASILAHEAMHVWMRLSKNVPYPLPLKVEEGLCQVVSRMYLKDVDKAISDRNGHDGGRNSSNNSSSSSSSSSGGGAGSRHTSFATAMQRLDYCPEVSPLGQVTDRRDHRLRAFFCCQIETDKSEVYGDGFREAQECVSVLGLDIVLETVRETRQLPMV